MTHEHTPTTDDSQRIALDQEMLSRIADSTGFELAYDLQALDQLATSPATDELPDGVVSIMDAGSLKPPTVEGKAFSILDAPEYVEPDPVTVIKRKDLGRVATSHDALMKSTRAHDFDKDSIRGRRIIALNAIADNDGKRTRKHGEVPKRAERPIDKITDKVTGGVSKLIDQTSGRANDPRNLGPAKAHIQPKYPR